MNITRGKVKSAVKMLVYGPEGVGKTTFAAQTPGCVFIDTEGSTRHMDVARFDPPAELGDVLNQLNYVLGHTGEIGTIVIDTVDWMETLIFNAICTEKEIKNIEDIPYGKGYVFAKQKMQQILELLQAIVDRGVNVCLVCHSMIRKFELPDKMGSYDRYMLKLNEKNIAPLIKEWVDLMLFANYRTDIVIDDKTKTKKGTGGQKRIMYANHTACWDAKNRFGLPDEMPFDFGQIAHLFGEAPPVETKTAEEPAAEPAKNPIPDLKPPEHGKVETVVELPKPARKAAKKDEKPSVRPDNMRSESEQKDELLERLWGLMVTDMAYDTSAIQAVCAEKEYYDLETPINEYSDEFLEFLIEEWETVRGLALTKIHNLPF